MTCAAYAVLASLIGMMLGGVIGFIVGVMWVHQSGYRP
jgi:gas vesicle protein